MMDSHLSSHKGISHSSSQGGGEEEEEEEEDAAQPSDRIAPPRSGAQAILHHTKMPTLPSAHSSRPNSRDQSPLHAAGGRYDMYIILGK